MHQTTFEAIGTRWWIEVFDNLDEIKCADVFNSCAFLIQEFDKKYSRFKNNSVLTQLNTERIIENPDPEFIELLLFGQQLFNRTNNKFNILIGQVLESRGYDADYTFKASGITPQIGNPNTDLIITDTKIKVLKGNVDNGGYGKGYLIDLVAEHLKAQGVQFFLINAGGDMYVTSELGEPIIVHLEHPTKPQKSIGTTTLLNQGFAASSPFKRQWKINNETVSHIINEGTEQFASYVKAETARDADAFATTALLSTTDELLEINKREHISISRFSPSSGNFWRTSDFI